MNLIGGTWKDGQQERVYNLIISFKEYDTSPDKKQMRKDKIDTFFKDELNHHNSMSHRDLYYNIKYNILEQNYSSSVLESDIKYKLNKTVLNPAFNLAIEELYNDHTKIRSYYWLTYIQCKRISDLINSFKLDNINPDDKQMRKKKIDDFITNELRYTDPISNIVLYNYTKYDMNQEDLNLAFSLAIDEMYNDENFDKDKARRDIRTYWNKYTQKDKDYKLFKNIRNKRNNEQKQIQEKLPNRTKKTRKQQIDTLQISEEMKIQYESKFDIHINMLNSKYKLFNYFYKLEFIDYLKITKFIGDDKVLEIGAGSGYHADILNKVFNIDITTTDKNIESEDYTILPIVEKLSHMDALTKYGDNTNVLIMFMPLYDNNDDWPGETITNFKGNKIITILIGTEIGTFDDAAGTKKYFDELKKDWICIGKSIVSATEFRKYRILLFYERKIIDKKYKNKYIKYTQKYIIQNNL